jgi:hypothetical protein
MFFEEKLFLCGIEMVSKKRLIGENNYPKKTIGPWESLKRRLAQEHTYKIGPKERIILCIENCDNFKNI